MTQSPHSFFASAHRRPNPQPDVDAEGEAMEPADVVAWLEEQAERGQVFYAQVMGQSDRTDHRQVGDQPGLRDNVRPAGGLGRGCCLSDLLDKETGTDG